MGRELSAELPIPDRPEDVTPEFLTAALADSGVLRHGRVTEARSRTWACGQLARGRERGEAGRRPAWLLGRGRRASD
jgi:hypothetical protein